MSSAITVRIETEELYFDVLGQLYECVMYVLCDTTEEDKDCNWHGGPFIDHVEPVLFKVFDRKGELRYCVKPSQFKNKELASKLNQLAIEYADNHKDEIFEEASEIYAARVDEDRADYLEAVERDEHVRKYFL